MAILAQNSEPFQPAPTFVVSADVLEESLRPPEIICFQYLELTLKATSDMSRLCSTWNPVVVAWE